MTVWLTGLLCSLAPLLFSYLRTKGISFLSFFFFPVILFFLTESFCCYKDVFEMYLTEFKV